MDILVLVLGIHCHMSRQVLLKRQYIASCPAEGVRHARSVEGLARVSATSPTKAERPELENSKRTADGYSRRAFIHVRVRRSVQPQLDLLARLLADQRIIGVQLGFGRKCRLLTFEPGHGTFLEVFLLR